MNLKNIKKTELVELFNWVYHSASKEVKYLQFSCNFE